MCIIRVEDGGVVLFADVVALAVGCGWVVCIEEDLQQVVVANQRRVVFDPDGLHVSGIAAADLLIGWVIGESARVSRHNL